jgi:hypothetical protein
LLLQRREQGGRLLFHGERVLVCSKDLAGHVSICFDYQLVTTKHRPVHVAARPHQPLAYHLRNRLCALKDPPHAIGRAPAWFTVKWSKLSNQH